MNNSFKFYTIVVFSVCLIGTFVFFGFAQEAKSGGKIIEALASEPTELDIKLATRRPEGAVLNLISEPLFIMGPDLKVKPLLAKSYEASDDHLTWTIKLKKGIEFHDGNLVDAEAVKFSLNRNKNGNSGWMLDPVKEIDVIDRYTLDLHLSEPYPMLPNYLANYWMGIVSPDKVKKYGDDYGVKAISGTGPFKFKNWKSGDSLVLERNENYSHGPDFATNQGPAYVEEWVFRFIPENSTLVAELQRGNVDLSYYIGAETVEQLATHPNTSIAKKIAPSNVHIGINLGYSKEGGEALNKPFDDVRVREAIAHAVSKEAVIKAAMMGVGEPTYTLTPPNVKMYWDGAWELGKKYTQYDPERSKQLLENAGWVDSDGDGVGEKDGKELKAIYFAFSIPRYKRIAEVSQPMLESVGFKIELKILEAGTLYERLERGEHDLISTAYFSWTVPQDGLIPMLHSKYIGTNTNHFHYNNPEVEELLEISQSSTEEEERIKAINKVQKIIIEDVICVPIANPYDVLAYKNNVGGVTQYTKHEWAFNSEQAMGLRALEFYKSN